MENNKEESSDGTINNSYLSENDGKSNLKKSNLSKKMRESHLKNFENDSRKPINEEDIKIEEINKEENKIDPINQEENIINLNNQNEKKDEPNNQDDDNFGLFNNEDKKSEIKNQEEDNKNEIHKEEVKNSFNYNYMFGTTDKGDIIEDFEILNNLREIEKINSNQIKKSIPIDRENDIKMKGSAFIKNNPFKENNPSMIYKLENNNNNNNTNNNVNNNNNNVDNNNNSNLNYITKNPLDNRMPEKTKLIEEDNKKNQEVNNQNKELISDDKLIHSNNINNNNNNNNLNKSNSIHSFNKKDNEVNGQKLFPLNQNNELPERIPLNLENYSLNINRDLEDIKTIYIGVEKNIFQFTHCQSCNSPSYKIYYLTEDKKVKTLFTVSKHYTSGKCCYDSCKFCYCQILPCLCCSYACNDFIYFQLDYIKDSKPFFTQGIKYQKGCQSCLLPFGCKCCVCSNIFNLTKNDNPKNPSFNYGENIGSTINKSSICYNPICTCYSCCYDQIEIYNKDKQVKWIIGRNENNCDKDYNCRFLGCNCGCCDECCKECNSDFHLIIFNDQGESSGKILIPNGICSEKLEKDCCACKCCCGGCCSLERITPHYQIEFPNNANSADKFYIIAGVIMYEFVSGMAQ